MYKTGKSPQRAALQQPRTTTTIEHSNYKTFCIILFGLKYDYGDIVKRICTAGCCRKAAAAATPTDQ